MDVKQIETGNGGDIVKHGDFIKVINGFQNMPYLAMFGGNVEQTTPKTRRAGEQVFDWWGNSLLFPNNPEAQFNSLTERTLMEVPLNSFGRSKIQSAVLADLDFMRKWAKIFIEVSIIGIDKVKIFIAIKRPDNLEADEFIFIWDATIFELTTDETFPARDFNYILTEDDFILMTEDDDLLLY